MSAPLHSCPYANKAGKVIMHLVQTGKVETKTGRALYEVHLPTESGRTKKVGRLLTLEDAGRAAQENEKDLGWDKLPPIVYDIAPPDPAVMAQMAERKKAETPKKAETARKGAAAETSASGSEGQAGGSRARAQPKASERSPRAVVKTPDPIVAAARRKRFP